MRLFGGTGRRWLMVLGLVIAGSSMAVLSQERQPGKTESDKRLPIPTANDQSKAQTLVREIFAKDLAAARESTAKTKLAAIFAQQGRDLREEPTYRYVLLSEAVDLAADAGDASQALVLVDDLARFYRVPGFERKAQALKRVSEAGGNAQAQQTLIDIILPLWSDAVDADQYAAAKIFSEVAETSAAKAKSDLLIQEIRRKKAELAEVEKGFRSLEVYRERLKQNPNDREANLKLGIYHGFLKRQWPKALPFLANGSDSDLAKLAQSDLINPKEARDQLELADSWWMFAQTSKESSQPALQQRAGYWYEKAVTHLTGLHRTKALKRIEKMQESLAGTSAPTTNVGPAGLIQKLEGHAEEVKSVAISSDGRYGASAGVDQTVRIWDLVTNKEEKVLRGHSKQVWGVAFLPTQRQLLSVSWDASARLWDLREGMETRRFPHRLDLNGVAVSRDGTTFLTASDDHNVYLWNTATGEEIRRFPGHSNFVYSVAFAPNGLHFASGGVDKTVRIFDVSSGQLVRTMDSQASTVTHVLFTPDGRFVLSAGDNAIHVWDAATGKEAKKFEGHRGNIPAIAISHDGRRLITGGDDRFIRVWDFLSGKEIAKLEGHTDTITCLAISPDGRRLLSGSVDRTIRHWNLPAR